MRIRPARLTAMALAAVLLAGLAGCSRSGSESPATETRGAPPTAQSVAPAVVASSSSPSGTTGSPVTVQVCGAPVTYTQVPQRAVTHDVSITEMFLFLGLGDKLVGYSGIPSASKEIDARYKDALARVPMLSQNYTNLEAVLGVQADFFFGGWSYGFREGQLTPALLAQHGVASYVLTESCIRVVSRDRVSMEDTFTDLRNIGKIFHVEAHAESLVQGLERDLRDLEQRTRNVGHRPRVFVYDSLEDTPVTSGRFGMPHAMIEAAGGTNIFDDIPSNWPRGNWEDVVARDPEWIVIVDYGHPKAQGKIDFLLRKPELSEVDAIRHKRFFVLTYAEATPGPRNVAKARELAQALHPALMPPAKP